MTGTRRQRALRRAISELLPRVPLADAEPIYQQALSGANLRGLPPSIALWLAAVSHIRHRHTDYDELLAEGYDRDAARFFVLEATNAMLTQWGATRQLAPEQDDLAAAEGAAGG